MLNFYDDEQSDLFTFKYLFCSLLFDRIKYTANILPTKKKKKTHSL